MEVARERWHRAKRPGLSVRVAHPKPPIVHLAVPYSNSTIGEDLGVDSAGLHRVARLHEVCHNTLNDGHHWQGDGGGNDGVRGQPNNVVEPIAVWPGQIVK